MNCGETIANYDLVNLYPAAKNPDFLPVWYRV